MGASGSRSWTDADLQRHKENMRAAVSEENPDEKAKLVDGVLIDAGIFEAPGVVAAGSRAEGTLPPEKWNKELFAIRDGVQPGARAAARDRSAEMIGWGGTVYGQGPKAGGGKRKSKRSRSKRSKRSKKSKRRSKKPKKSKNRRRR